MNDRTLPPAFDRLASVTSAGIILLLPAAVLGIGSSLFAFDASSALRIVAGVAALFAIGLLLRAAVIWRPFRQYGLVDASEMTARRRRVQDVLADGDSLQVVFQPVIDLASGACTGHEALARFADGRGPDEWFNEARAVGLGVELEMAAIAKAAQRYRGKGQLSINLSPDTLTSPAFMEYLWLWKSGSRMVVELTEHAIVEDYKQIATVVDRIRAVGALIAVDDAGSGTSSMRHILDLKPDIIKLDRSLIAGLDTDKPRRSMAASLVRFAVDIGALLVAEGIEREEERAACLDLGITFGQGYLLGRPGPL